MTFTAKKSLGQNFIHAPQIVSVMIHAGNINKNDTVLEIGPGKGALTSKLLGTGAHIIAVEKDEMAVEYLKEKFQSEIKNKQLEIINEDILNFIINQDNYILVANIPYYITGEFLRKFLESENPPIRMVIMLQKEVAKRIISNKESILSISVKAYGQSKYVCSVPRKFFRPIPNVDSAVILIENISKKFFTESKIDEKYFFEVLKAGFAHKRKILVRNLEEKIPRDRLEMVWNLNNLSKNIRAENLTLQMWKKIVGDSQNT